MTSSKLTVATFNALPCIAFIKMYNIVEPNAEIATDKPVLFAASFAPAQTSQ